MTAMRAGVVLAILGGCGSTPPPAQTPPQPQPSSRSSTAPDERCRQADPAPAGTPEDYAAPALAGFVIAPPRACERGRAYIRVERLAGARRLGTARDRGGGFAEGCTKKPAGAADCPVINVGVPGHEVYDELVRQGITAGGPGLGPCGDINGDYAAWNMSITVESWHHAELAVRLIAAALDRYDIAGTLGVAVKGPTCEVLL